MNGFPIIGNEKIQSPQKNLPTEKQLSVGHAIGDETLYLKNNGNQRRLQPSII